MPQMDQPPNVEPEMDLLGKCLRAFDDESDRGAALVAASMLDERLEQILRAFMIECDASNNLLSGFNAPLGTFSARASAAMSLGLIQENEFKEITLIRKIRNVFGHGWEPQTFDSQKVAAHVIQLPWCGPSEYEPTATNRARFNAAVSMLLVDLMWRVRLVEWERRQIKTWPNKSRT